MGGGDKRSQNCFGNCSSSQGPNVKITSIKCSVREELWVHCRRQVLQVQAQIVTTDWVTGQAYH